ncbi:hypothetical protein ACAG26_15120 [Mycobacterium sp. pUA109]|uniref:hypothetical protein n=1 Tax=Mycobacterium sp. pUA109 TaxID=3238982 RepID=UPI00351B0731
MPALRKLHTFIDVAAVLLLLPCTGGYAGAAPETALTSAVDAARGPCPPLQWDPLVARAAEMMNHATDDYVNHRTGASPDTDPMPALRTIGYTGSKATLLSGYGAGEAAAIHGLIVQGYKLIPDCSYTHYGTDILHGAGFVLTSVVLGVS